MPIRFFDMLVGLLLRFKQVQNKLPARQLTEDAV